MMAQESLLHNEQKPDDTSKKVGLALSGGVGRIAAHIGVLDVLEREGISVDCVAGTSAGAIIGGLYCAGLQIETMKKMAQKVRWQSVARPVFSGQGFVSFKMLEYWIIDMVCDLHFEDLSLGPFAVVATDLELGQPVVLKEGPIAPAIRASCSVPGFVVPAEINGRLLGDGGVSNNLPESVARDLGADYVIGVDLFVPSVRRRLGPFGFGFAALETLVRRSQGGVDAADCLITPDLAGRSYLDLSKRAELIALGAKATAEKIPEIKAALGL